MDRLYALGARQRNLLMKNEHEWNLYESALILELDLKSGSARSRVEYKSPSEARAHEYSSVVFKAGTIVGNTLYACTSTEVLIFSLPEFQQTGYVSLPALNDVHHVTPTSDGNLLVANTGLDMVVKFNLQGEVLSEWAVLDEELWSPFLAISIIGRSTAPSRIKRIQISCSSSMAKPGSRALSSATPSVLTTAASELISPYNHRTTA